MLVTRPQFVRSLLGFLFVTLFVASAPAQAQITSLGVSPPAPAGVLSTVAYDDKHHVYLQVWEFNRDTWGRFVNAAGQPLGANFVVAPNKLSFTGKPRVAYARDHAGVDEFVVIYLTDVNKFDSGANVYAQRVVFTGAAPNGGVLAGAPIPVGENSTNGNIRQEANDIVFNPLTGRFLIAWTEYAGPADVKVRQIAADGTPVAASVNVSNGPGGQGASSVSFDWIANRYFVNYSGDDPLAPNTIGHFGNILDGDSAAVLTPRILIAGGFFYEGASAFIPERNGFLALFTGFAPDRNVYARFIPTAYAGSLPDPMYGAMATPGVNEGAVAGDYDFISRTVFVGAMREPKNIGCLLLNGVGTPITAPVNCSTVNPLSGTFYPTVRPAEGGQFGMSYITDYAQTWVERFQVAPAPTAGPHCCGGGGPPLGVQIQIDTPGNSQTITPPFAIAGWAVDTRHGSGPGIDVMHIWAVPQGPGTPIFVGVAPTGTARPDVGQVFGPNFTNSGYGVTLSNIPPGGYTLVFYPHSTFTGQFEYDKAKTMGVTIVGGALTAIDTPGWGQTIGGYGIGLIVAGWAIDLLNPNGTGVDAVHVWAINATTGTPTFMGAATMGLQRTDVKNIYGAPYEFSGYGLQNTVGLPPGTYYIAVFSHSVGAPQFNVARIVGINIQ